MRLLMLMRGNMLTMRLAPGRDHGYICYSSSGVHRKHLIDIKTRNRLFIQALKHEPKENLYINFAKMQHRTRNKHNPHNKREAYETNKLKTETRTAIVRLYI